MRAGAPTRRELILAALLLVLFVFLTQSDTIRRTAADHYDRFTQDGLSGLYGKGDREGAKQASSYDDEFDLNQGGSESAEAEAGVGVQITSIPQPAPTASAGSTAYEPMKFWGSGTPAETEVIQHAPGWTILDNLYILNGTMFVVTDDPESVPSRDAMISKGIWVENGMEAALARLPGDEEMRIIDTATARALFGQGASRMDGVTWLANDPNQFITHYYHWSAELLFGFWRTYSSLDPSIPSTGETTLPAPTRLSFVHVGALGWRDYAHMNEYVTHAAFPSLSGEYAEDWDDRAALATPFVLERVVLADRSAAMTGDEFWKTWRTASSPAAGLPGSAHWWSTVRNNVLEFAGLDVKALAEAGSTRPVITYISRQNWGRRMLIPEHHERLVKELEGLRERYGYEVNVVDMDKLTRDEQIRLSGRTTIMMGVHGNGLTSLLWMHPNPRSTVMEFFFPGGYAYDYEWTARALGMLHYGFWDNQTFSSPDLPPSQTPEGFQGNSIPIDGALVARLCHERLSLIEERDD